MFHQQFFCEKKKYRIFQNIWSFRALKSYEWNKLKQLRIFKELKKKMNVTSGKDMKQIKFRPKIIPRISVPMIGSVKEFKGSFSIRTINLQVS